MNNLRNRPFLILSYRYTLKNTEESKKEGFRDLAVWNPIENMEIVDRVKDKKLISSDVIIDLLNNKIVKCIDSTLDHNKLINAIIHRYFDDIKIALSEWMNKNPENLEKVQKFVETFSKTNSDNVTE